MCHILKWLAPCNPPHEKWSFMSLALCFFSCCFRQLKHVTHYQRYKCSHHSGYWKLNWNSDVFFFCLFVCSQIWSKLITNYLWLVYHLCWFRDYAVSLLRVMLAFTFCDSSTVHITPSVIWINGEVEVRWVFVIGHQSTGVHKRKTAEASKTPYFFPSYFQTAGTNVFQSSVNSTNHRGTDRFISDLGHLQSQIQAWFFVNANSLAFMSLAWIQYLAALSQRSADVCS